MREVNEKEVNDLCGEAIPPVVCKTERDDTESAVCLKQLPDCYLLGVSSETRDKIQFFIFDDEAEARVMFDKYCQQMKETGYPFCD